jgi:Ca2+-binding RTX toxin-like protein
MSTPVYIVAGQSNAFSLNGGNGGTSLAGAYGDLTGSSNVIVAPVHSAGAPLTWGRTGPDWFTPGEMFDQMVATIKTALSNPDAYLASVVWIQGEGDTWGFARATEYAARLTDLVNRLQTQLLPLDGQTHDFRFTVLSLSANTPAKANQPNWDTVRAQQLSLDHPRIDVIDVDKATSSIAKVPNLFQADGLHYAASANDPILGALLDKTSLRLDGTMSADRLNGLSGNDILRGGGGDDQLSGQGGNDYLRAWTGNDRLIGGMGRDTIVGDLGADRLVGGYGADIFVFNTAQDSGATPTTCDVIEDFATAFDRIALSGIDANPFATGDQAFRYLGAAQFDGSAAALRWVRMGDGVQVQLDLNGDRLADALIMLTAATTLTATDFWL